MLRTTLLSNSAKVLTVGFIARFKWNSIELV